MALMDVGLGRSVVRGRDRVDGALERGDGRIDGGVEAGVGHLKPGVHERAVGLGSCLERGVDIAQSQRSGGRGTERTGQRPEVRLKGLGGGDVGAEGRVERVDRSLGQGVDGRSRLGGQDIGGDESDGALLVQRDQVGHHLESFELEHVVDMGEARQELLVHVLVEAADQALGLGHEAVAIDRAIVEIGKRSVGELCLEGTEHGLDHLFRGVLALFGLCDQSGQRRSGERLGRRCEQLAVFQRLKQEDPASGSPYTNLSSLSAHHSPGRLSLVLWAALSTWRHCRDHPWG